MNIDLYDLLQEKGPDALVGQRTLINNVPHEIVSLAAVGDSMIVYNLRNLHTMQENMVMKIPRSRPGTAEHTKIMESYRLAMERIPHLIVPTQVAKVRLEYSSSEAGAQPDAKEMEAQAKKYKTAIVALVAFLVIVLIFLFRG